MKLFILLLLVGVVLYFAGTILPKYVNQYILPVYMFLSAIFLLFFDKSSNQPVVIKRFKVIFSLLIIVLSVYIIFPSKTSAAEWSAYSESAYNSSKANNEKMIIDFYADWCIPCKELDKVTFSNPKVKEKLREFSTYKVDMTETMNERTESLRNKFNIAVMPTVILINSKGEEVQRLTGFVGADEFLKIINSIK